MNPTLQFEHNQHFYHTGQNKACWLHFVHLFPRSDGPEGSRTLLANTLEVFILRQNIFHNNTFIFDSRIVEV